MPKRLLNLLLLLLAACLLAGCGLFGGGSSDPGNASAAAKKAVRTAYSQMGKPYRPGGASPRQGFDCSGLIYWAYRQNGVNVPRRSTDQLRAGYSVDRRNPLPGDIVVFRMHGSSLHTGMYAGGNSFIHSPKPGSRVRMEKLSQPYWQKKLIAVRRVAG